MSKTKSAKPHFEPIAIIGVGALFPGSKNSSEFWQHIVAGNDLITDTPASHWLIEDYYDPNPKPLEDKTYCKRSGFLPTVEFDTLEFGIPPNVIPATDTSQLLALLVAKQVLNNASQGNYLNWDLSKTSIILGAAALEALQYVAGRMQRPVWEKILREFGLVETEVNQICQAMGDCYTNWQENTFPGLLGNVIAGRIANRFDLGGTNCITDAACAGTFAALSASVNELQQHTSDMVITGGVDTLNDIVMFMCFSKTQALSMSGECRPFSAQADGTLLGEGLGMFALKRLSDAEQNQDKIYAVIKGVGSSSDGRAKSIYAPVASGQKKAILRAYETAQFDPESVGLIEAHGTGTRAGDHAEFSGLNLAFSENKTITKKYCALGSIKSQIGHTKSAAGAAGLFKAVMALHHKVLPPTIKIDTPSPDLDFASSPFYLNTQLRPWFHDLKTPRRAGVSSFGFGGTNFHIALEEYQGPLAAKRLNAAAAELFLISGKNKSEILTQIESWFAETEKENFSVLAKNSQQQLKTDHLTRLAIVAKNQQDLITKLNQAKQHLMQPSQLPPGIYFGDAIDHGKVAFLFPGQGSQYLNMGNELIAHDPELLDLWQKLDANLGLNQIVFPQPTFDLEEQKQQQENLTATQSAQPALAITSLCYWHWLKKLGIQADCVAGHSFGELSALYAAGGMTAETLIKAACKRGELMAAASTEKGAMIAVQHSAQYIIEKLKSLNSAVIVANYNSPEQVVLSGSEKEIATIIELFAKENIRCQPLKVATAFHSPLVENSVLPFKNFLATMSFQSLKIPVYANQTAMPYDVQTSSISDSLSQQLAHPVQFQSIIEQMYQSGVRTFIEVGPHQALTGLVKNILQQKPHHAIALNRRGENALTRTWHALAEMITLGLNPNLETLWQNIQLEEINRDKKSHPAGIVKINGSNYNKPYPANKNKTLIEPPIKFTKKEVNMSDNNTVMLMELQKQLVEAHNTYQRAMAESHMMFLNSMGQLAHQTPNANIATAPIPNFQLPKMAVPQAAAPQPAPIMPMAPTPQPIIMTPPVAPMPQQSIEQPQQAQPSSLQGQPLQDLLLNIVAEKTGYPVEMLNLDMGIESELGIDSIKRVEILSNVSERIPNLPELDPAALAQLKTLRDIVNYMELKK